VDVSAVFPLVTLRGSSSISRPLFTGVIAGSQLTGVLMLFYPIRSAGSVSGSEDASPVLPRKVLEVPLG